MKKAIIISLTTVISFSAGWFLKGAFTSTKIITYQDRLQAQIDNQNSSIIKTLISNAPSSVYFSDDVKDNLQTFDYIGVIGKYKVVKYQNHIKSKSKYKLIFYNLDNTYCGYYSIFTGFGQVYKTDNDSLQVDHLGINLNIKLLDSLHFGPDLWVRLKK
jgi:hypothetical protein